MSTTRRRNCLPRFALSAYPIEHPAVGYSNCISCRSV
uniref:Uncharacterized protein n=1 Tax=Zea mays TaxID=4577 RepID=B4FN91_MAIZE|nr:unknown [Zea mays]